MSFEKDFLLDIANRIFGYGESEYREFFLRRFCRNSYGLKHKEIGGQLNKANSRWGPRSNWGDIVGEVMALLIKAFDSEIENIESWGKLSPGRPSKGEGPWELAYKWLWEYKYRCWLSEQDLWLRLVDNAQHAGGRMHMEEVPDELSDDNRGLQLLNMESKIICGKSYQFLMDFKLEGYLLLLAKDDAGVC